MQDLTEFISAYGKSTYHMGLYLKLISTRGYRKLEDGGYTEKHHVIPKKLGGSNANSNLINLTAREHFIAHLLLYKATRTREMSSAIWLMSQLHPDRVKLSAKEFSRIREEAATLHSAFMTGTKRTKEQRLNCSIVKRGNTATKNTVWVNKKGVSRMIPQDLVDRYVEDGYALGRKAQEDYSTTQRYTPLYSSEVERNKGISVKNRQKAWMHKGEKSLRVDAPDVNRYLSNGFLLGRGKLGWKMHSSKGRIWVHIGVCSKMVELDTLSTFLEKGYQLGRGKLPRRSDGV